MELSGIYANLVAYKFDRKCSILQTKLRTVVEKVVSYLQKVKFLCLQTVKFM